LQDLRGNKLSDEERRAAEEIGVVWEQDPEGETRVYGPEAPEPRRSISCGYLGSLVLGTGSDKGGWMLRLTRECYSVGEEPIALSRYLDILMLLSVLCGGGLGAPFSAPGLIAAWEVPLSITPSWKTPSCHAHKPI